MAQTKTSQRSGVRAGSWKNPLAEPAALSGKPPPPWLAASVADFRLIQRILNLVRPVRAVSFGGILVFVTLLTFLLRHSPDGQSVLLAVSLYGLPICLAAWFTASSAQRRLSRRKNHIKQRVYGAGMHLDDQGRALTDNPHPALILDPATGSPPNMT
jgi:hypothetical protein